MNNEIWKYIPGYEGIYMISDKGNIKSIRYSKEKLLKPYKSNGYLKISLSVKNNKNKYFVHRLVASAFLNLELDNLNQVVNHIDGIRDNNSIDNLELMSQVCNVIDGIKRNLDNELVKFISYIDVKNWEAHYPVNNKTIKLGNFECLKEALIAVETAQLVTSL